MRFLITGGAGFIGSHLAQRLISERHEVTVLDNFATGRRENIAAFADRIRLIEGSVSDIETCRTALRDADFVLHQAALGSVPRSVRDPIATHESNANGTLNLLVAAREAGVKRFVYAGSSSAYGDTDELPKHEDMPSRPLSPYAVSKSCGEQYCAAFFRTYGLETVTLRYFNVFGARQDPTSQYAAVIPKFATAALANESPTIFGDGEQTRDFTHVRNVVEANLRACFAPHAVAGKVFNVGAGKQTSLNELWRHIKKLTGATVEAVYADQRPGDVRDSLAALERSRTLLGYEPSVQLVEGLQLTIDSLRGAAS